MTYEPTESELRDRIERLQPIKPSEVECLRDRGLDLEILRISLKSHLIGNFAMACHRGEVEDATAEMVKIHAMQLYSSLRAYNESLNQTVINFVN